MTEEKEFPELAAEMLEQLEARIYPINDRDMSGAWAFGIFPKDGKWLYVDPQVFSSRSMAAQSARVLCRMTGLSLIECETCQDVSYPYESILWRRMFFKALIIGAALFCLYFLLVRLFT